MADTMKYASNMNGALWVQPNGPVNDLHYMGCHEVTDIPFPHPDVDYGWCVDENREFQITHELKSPPATPSATITTLLGQERAWLEKLLCPPDLYLVQQTCNGRGSPYNADRVTHMPRARIVTDTLNNPLSIDATNKTMKNFEVKYADPHIVLANFGSRQATAEATNLHGVAACRKYKCTDACGKYQTFGDIVATGASGAVAASANVQFTTTGGATWTAGAADPFAVGAAKNVIDLVYVLLDNGTCRIVASKAAEAGVQGLVAYSDDGGAVWTSVNIGGGAAGHGATVPGGMYAIGKKIWLASAGGYIYFSDDAGVSWTAQESGVIFATAFTQIKFFNANIGVAVTTAGNAVFTTNGGLNWAACTAVAAGDNLCVEVPTSSMVYVGNDDGELWVSYDLGASWEELNWSNGTIAAGTLNNIKRAPENDHCLYLLHNTAGPVGTIWRTWNGGTTWDKLNDITNAGIYGLEVINSETAYVTGNVVGAATAVIIKTNEKYPPV
jgi:photosystem II stability/assembly factor-like uncharacterized protein